MSNIVTADQGLPVLSDNEVHDFLESGKLRHCDSKPAMASGTVEQSLSGKLREKINRTRKESKECKNTQDSIGQSTPTSHTDLQDGRRKTQVGSGTEKRITKQHGKPHDTSHKRKVPNQTEQSDTKRRRVRVECSSQLKCRSRANKGVDSDGDDTDGSGDDSDGSTGATEHSGYDTDGSGDATAGNSDATDCNSDSTEGNSDATDGSVDAIGDGGDATDGSDVIEGNGNATGSKGDATEGGSDATEGSGDAIVVGDATDGSGDTTEGKGDATEGSDAATQGNGDTTDGNGDATEHNGDDTEGSGDEVCDIGHRSVRCGTPKDAPAGGKTKTSQGRSQQSPTSDSEPPPPPADDCELPPPGGVVRLGKKTDSGLPMYINSVGVTFAIDLTDEAKDYIRDLAEDAKKGKPPTVSKLKYLTVQALEQIIKYNDRPLYNIGGHPQMAAVVADYMKNGVPPRCPTCKRGALRFSNGKKKNGKKYYWCPGYSPNGYHFYGCSFKAQRENITRLPFAYPE